jgi:hypothetical protein
MRSKRPSYNSRPLVLLCLFAVWIGLGRCELQAQTSAAGDIVISQFYSHGGNAGSTYQNKYLELYNRTNTAIDIRGWPIYLASDTGAFNESISFSGSQATLIGPHRYFSGE